MKPGWKPPYHSPFGPDDPDYERMFYNSGPSPSSVYRTAAVGSTVLIATAHLAPGRGDMETRVARAARGTLRAMGVDAAALARHESTRELLECMLHCTLERGVLAPFIGVVQRLPNGERAGPLLKAVVAASDCAEDFPWLGDHASDAIIRRAWSICAVSCMSPPVILWTRTPSLAAWRDGAIYTLRWLGGTEGGA